MAMMIVRQRVRDYFDWRRVFDERKAQRRAAGLINERFFRGEHDGNDLIVVMEASDLDKARQYASSAERMDALAAGEVIGKPLDCFVA